MARLNSFVRLQVQVVRDHSGMTVVELAAEAGIEIEIAFVDDSLRRTAVLAMEEEGSSTYQPGPLLFHGKRTTQTRAINRSPRDSPFVSIAKMIKPRSPPKLTVAIYHHLAFCDVHSKKHIPARRHVVILPY
jgi:hypothetical protein